MTTPTQESLDRAEKCASAIDDIYHSTAHAQDGTTRTAIVNSLALEFDRERLEGKIEGRIESLVWLVDRCFHLAPSAWRSEAQLEIDRLKAQLAARPLQGTALNATER